MSLSIDEKLADLSKTSSDQYIFRVHQRRRKQNEETYEPEMISIGPYHHGKENLKKMEKYKFKYLRGILERQGKESAESYIDALRKVEKKARDCYAEDLCLSRDDFVAMMLLDGCFTIEFLRKYKDKERLMDDPVFRMKWLVEILCRDMLLFENQLPFFVLQLLFDMTKIEGREENLIHLAISCLNHCIAADHVSHSSFNINQPEAYAFHLLSLVYDSWCSSFAEARYVIKEEHKDSSVYYYRSDYSVVTLERLNSNLSQEEDVMDLELIKSVSELEEDGIKFSKAMEIPNSSKKSRSWIDIQFQNGVMEIPTLVVQDHTESLLRNLIAYEEHMIDPRYNGKVVSDYTTFMNCLVNSSSDVKTLRHQKVIKNLLGSDEVLSDMFNRISTNVSLNYPWFSYRKIFKDVNEHCSKRRNRWIADLKKKYFNNPWSITAFLAATFLLVLTLMQTIFSIL